MRASLFRAALAAAVLVGACSPDVITATNFRAAGTLATKLGLDSVTCTITWRSQVNDPNRPYIAKVSFAGDTGVLPDTGTVVATDSLFTTGSATVEGDFRAPDFLVSWQFFWDTLSAADSGRVKACVVQ